MHVEGVEALMANLKRRLDVTRDNAGVSVTVGYTSAYAMYVHENNINIKYNMKLKGFPRPKSKGGKFWDPQGQNKFLEAPARSMAEEMARTITDLVKSGQTLAKALLVAGFMLQKASQALVPVITGNLRASAFTRLTTIKGTTTFGAEGASSVEVRF